MERAEFWFSLAVGVVMTALPIEFGNRLSPTLVTILFWGGLLLMAISGSVLARSTLRRRIMKRSIISGNVGRNNSGPFITIGGDVIDSEISNNRIDEGELLRIGGRARNTKISGNRKTGRSLSD